MLMHHFGGVYLDSDVECVTPLDSLLDPLPRYSAW
jgi:mannosyltransferase OCH1-like enzyme